MNKCFRKIIPALCWPVSLIKRAVEGRGVRILMYHRVIDQPGDRLSVEPDNFEKQMDFLLSRGCRVMALPELPDLNTRRLSGAPMVALTFDDGYRDFYDFAFPVLKSRRLPATVFIVTGLLEGEIRLGRYRDCPEFSSPMSWDMLKEMEGYGISVGAHTHSHEDLPSLPPDRAEEEIIRSARIIEERTGGKPEWFSYPRGRLSPSVIEAVKRAGFNGAVTVRPGCNHFPGDLFVLRRTEISGDDDLRDFRMKLNGAFDLYHGFLQASWRAGCRG